MKRRFKLMEVMIISIIIIATGCKIDKGNEENSSYPTPNAILTTNAKAQVANFEIPKATAKATNYQISVDIPFNELEDIQDVEESEDIEDIEDVEDVEDIEDVEDVEVLEDIHSVDDNSTRVIDVKTKVKSLPKTILNEISYQKKRYPGMSVAVGIYSLDGTKGYEYNVDTAISGGCTIKAPYAMYVLQECERQGIDITKETLTYKKGMRNSGSGIIKNSNYGTKYTIEYLLKKLLGISDNTAYNILVSKFPLKRYQEFLNNINGQNLYGRQYGVASVIQRKNEWLTIYEYLNSDAKYADTLRTDLTNTKYCYIVDWMNDEHTYMHKSGWCNDRKYTCACDCAIIDDNYLLIVSTEDYKTGVAHTDTVRSIGVRVEEFANSLGGKIF